MVAPGAAKFITPGLWATNMRTRRGRPAPAPAGDHAARSSVSMSGERIGVLFPWHSQPHPVITYEVAAATKRIRGPRTDLQDPSVVGMVIRLAVPPEIGVLSNPLPRLGPHDGSRSKPPSPCDSA